HAYESNPVTQSSSTCAFTMPPDHRAFQEICEGSNVLLPANHTPFHTAAPSHLLTDANEADLESVTLLL
ncbi:hypothetical protein NQZ68_025763, partial [Dissostichus eleginoides]